MNAKVVFSKSPVELLCVGLAALVCVRIYTAAPVPVAVGAIGMACALPLVWKKPAYTVLLLAIILPFRDIHLVSIIHLKRFVIWTLLGYHLLRQFTSGRVVATRHFALFTKTTAFFVGIIVISLIKTASALYTTNYITPVMVKASILSDALVLFEGMLMLYIIYYALDDLAQIHRLLEAIFAASAVIGLFAVLQYVLEGPPPLVGVLFDQEYQFYGRATSVFSNPNDLGSFSAPMVVIALVSLIWGAASMSKKLLLILPSLIFNTLALLLSFSRGAMIQVFFGILVIGYLYYIKVCKRRLSRKVVVVVVCIVALFGLSVRYYDTYMRYRLSDYQGHDYYAALNWIKNISDFQRKQAVMKAIETFGDHPILGIGYNMFAGKKIAGAEYFGLSTHNQYLKILVEMGLLGFLPFLLLLGLIAKTGLRIWDVSTDEPVDHDLQITMLLLLAGIGTITCGYLFIDSLVNLSISGYLWIFSGAVFVLDRRYIA
ncbi:hypothetical protein GF339_09030 [candidate division KSB3 bacterium]|uniref:O-antigen ligase-related domain-containing protein n=1 Tax=candidate division KSB3 bacterium TaxID=2044937 RepID=A0A9D5JV38_9BACT|nr:hypothetical protein [candidate division KSB3 bacterium]MBD3324715.1 hypothetical protein [candidate division KSB3 bacterium]